MSTTKFLSMAVLLTVTAFRLPAAESAIEREAQDRKQIEKPACDVGGRILSLSLSRGGLYA